MYISSDSFFSTFRILPEDIGISPNKLKSASKLRETYVERVLINALRVFHKVPSDRSGNPRCYFSLCAILSKKEKNKKKEREKKRAWRSSASSNDTIGCLTIKKGKLRDDGVMSEINY